MIDWPAAGIAVAGAAVAGFLQGFGGFAFGLVAMAVWAWTIAPDLAGPMVVFGALIGRVLTLGGKRPDLGLARAMPLVVGGLAGLPLGVAILKNVDPVMFRLIVGFVLVAFAGLTLAAGRLPKIAFGGRLADGGVGFLGGLTGGFAGLPEAAAAPWLSLRGWKNNEQSAVLATFSIAMQAAALVLYGLAGMLTARTGLMFVFVAPALFLAALLGARLRRKKSGPGVRLAVLWLMGLSGAGLAAIAARHLIH